MKPTPHDDRRRDERYALPPMRIWVRSRSLPISFEVQLRDVSRVGIGFRSIWALDPNDELELEMPMLGVPSTIAKVCHARREGDAWVIGATLDANISIEKLCEAELQGKIAA